MDRFTPIAVVVTVLMDIGLNSLLEPVSAHISVVILLTCLQVALPMCALVFLFVMLMRTKLLQAGNFGGLLYKFRALVVVAPIYLSFLVAIRAIRIEAYARNTSFALLWDMPGYYEVFVIYRVVAIIFYFLILRTLMRLGDPLLYVQRVAPDAEAAPEFCKRISERQFRAVPQIIRGSMTLEQINRGVGLLNQLVVDKYQLLALDVRELRAIDTKEEAIQHRKRWETQQSGDDDEPVDCFADQDLSLCGDFDADAWRDTLQVLKYVNHLTPIKSTRQYTLLSNERRSSELQQWAAASGARIRQKLRDVKGRPGMAATRMRGVMA